MNFTENNSQIVSPEQNQSVIKQYFSFFDAASKISRISCIAAFIEKAATEITNKNNKGIKISDEEMKLFSEKYNDLKVLIDSIIKNNELYITDKNIV